MAHGKTGADHHHSRQKERQGQLHLKPDPVQPGRKARLAEVFDIGRQLPDRDAGRHAEAVDDLLARQCRREAELIEALGLGLGVELRQTPELDVTQVPHAIPQFGLGGFDPARGAGGGAFRRREVDERHDVEGGSVRIGLLSADNGLPGFVALPQPKPFVADRKRGGRPGRQCSRAHVVALHRGSHDRIDHRHADASHEQRNRHRGDERAQCRASGRARHHHLRGPGKTQEQGDRCQNDDERQYAIEQLGHGQERQFQRPGQSDLGGVEAAQLLDHVEQCDEQGKDRRHPEEDQEKLARDVEMQAPHSLRIACSLVASRQLEPGWIRRLELVRGWAGERAEEA